MTHSPKIDLKDLTEAELVGYAEQLGQPGFRGRQIMGWLYRPDITSFDQMTDLAKVFRSVLAENARISRFSDPILKVAADGCVKFGFTLEDGHLIESVLIPEPDRNTLCISSQVGCAMGCTFCLTGTMGFVRNLRPSEIVNQICSVRDYLLAAPEGSLIGPRKVTNVVFMGMGEPLNNFSNVLKALSIMTEQKGLDMATRRITVSTCGIVPQLKELGEKSPVNIAISLHAPNNQIRDTLMPVNRRYPIEALLETCRTMHVPKRKRIMFEYTLLEGINDSDADARQLAKILRKIPCKINLLAFNSSPGIPYKSPPRARILAFQKILIDSHYTVFIRNSRGDDISAACGQLAAEHRQKS